LLAIFFFALKKSGVAFYFNYVEQLILFYSRIESTTISDIISAH